MHYAVHQEGAGRKNRSTRHPLQLDLEILSVHEQEEGLHARAIYGRCVRVLALWDKRKYNENDSALCYLNDENQSDCVYCMVCELLAISVKRVLLKIVTITCAPITRCELRA